MRASPDDLGLTVTAPTPPLGRRLVVESCVLFLVALSVPLIALRSYWLDYYPQGDEFSLLAASEHFRPRSWLLSGFSDYFAAYPEWTAPNTDFVRPIVNLTYYLSQLLFGDTYGAQLIAVNYGVHAAATVTVYLVSRLIHRNTASVALWLAATLFFGAPFFGSEMPTQPAFAFDALAALFCVLAALLHLADRGTWAWLLTAAAVLTKESALPVAAALTVASFVGRRPRRAAALLVVPVGWLALRFAAFGGLGSVYTFSYTTLERISRSTFLPIGYAANAPGLTAVTDPGTIRLDDALFLTAKLVNVAILAGLVVSVVWVALSRRDLVASLRRDDRRPGGLILWSAVSVLAAAYMIWTDASARFGYIFLAFLCLAVSARIRSARAPLWIVAAIVLGMNLLGAAASTGKVNSSPARERHRTLVRASREFVSRIATLGAAETGRTVLVINDAVLGYAAPEYVRRFTHGALPIRRLNSLDIARCPAEELSRIDARLESRGPVASGAGVVRIRVPPCAEIVFENADIWGALAGRNFATRGDLVYAFPELRYTRTLDGFDTDFGKQLVVQIDDVSRYVLVAFTYHPEATVSVLTAAQE